MTTGERLRNIRLTRRKTLEETAEAIGMTATSISKYESDRVKNIPYENLEKLADFFDVSPYYILGLGDPGQTSPLILSIDEQLLIEDYRQLSEADKKTMHILLKRLLEVAANDEHYVQLTL
ncbi:helix-turn-helix domain-containing protein [Allobaculum mucilyticum]|uniref:helix-turn-helix domain-containing protein n=1 Tax=Allobaculum mucilyticum TaxID=2834459 RepID=UPI001E3ED570|nr:helix-turn-helix transcriptional regulator [Allobaculum mucilyticum]UNT96787.1 helix-turn-helix domain-containing protein [Allobaculum mucilyticum]